MHNLLHAKKQVLSSLVYLRKSLKALLCGLRAFKLLPDDEYNQQFG